MRPLVICADVDRVGGSQPVKCEGCGVALVISPATLKDTPNNRRVMCMDCGLNAIRKGDCEPMKLGPNQLLEIHRVLWQGHIRSSHAN
jgi:hypothetical protein